MVNIDTVYQRVLALANKEQRGYITPLEFNLHANQAQQQIFEQYFYDLDIAKQVPTDTTSTSDMIELIENKLAPFTTVQTVINGSNYPDNYRTGSVYVQSNTVIHEAELVETNEAKNYLYSQFHRRGLFRNPIYIKSSSSGSDIEVYDHNGIVTTNVTCEIISRPNKAEWGYDVINEKALYNASRATNFELHESEETELVYKILTLAGITINKPGLAQTGIALDTAKIQQEKQ
tara:strand:+ start:282 stop:980 length:699 start_codon:yes stop_codon:yes gene_type:complete